MTYVYQARASAPVCLARCLSPPSSLPLRSPGACLCRRSGNPRRRRCKNRSPVPRRCSSGVPHGLSNAVPGRRKCKKRAEASVLTEARIALEPHGRWQQHSRWGEVWIPANRSRDWRPYTVGRWVHTEEWGWYWVEDRGGGLLGLGDLSIMAAGSTMTNSDGRGSPAKSGAPASCNGGTARNMSAGRRCLRKRSSSNIANGQGSGFSSGYAISQLLRGSSG